jgi:membrane fusion protein, multidrug efflux system
MKKLLAIPVCIAILTGCSHTPSGEIRKDEAFRVRTAKVVSVKDDFSLGYSGTVEASQVIPLSFRILGTVQQIYVEVGDLVRKGQLLATLDPADLQNIYDAALAKYKQAEDAYERLKQVHDQGSLPEIKWVEMQTNLEQARSTMEVSKSNLDKCQLVSPVDAIVGRRNIEPGQSSVSLTSAPIELVKIETVFVKISVPENEINKFSNGLKASIKVSALGGQAFEGTVTNISPVAELMSRTYTVKITVNNPGHLLKPGMVCDVSLAFGTDATILVVPYQAVSKDNAGNTYVFLVSSDNKTVRKQLIIVGQYHNDGVQVLQGLTEGQTIVSEGIEKLSDNSSISL